MKRAPVPPNIRGLRREEAAAYLGISPSTFDALVKGGVMPRPKHMGGVTYILVWDIPVENHLPMTRRISFFLTNPRTEFERMSHD